MNCTERHKDGNCPKHATIELEWTEVIAEGWVAKVNRVYCEIHGEVKMATLAKRGIAYHEFHGAPV